MGIKNYYHNTTVKTSRNRIVVDEKLFEAERIRYVPDLRLSRAIVSDLEYGVGNRPTLPSCFDDAEFVSSGQIDRAVDIRHSQWDDLSAACNPVNVTKPTETVKTPTVEVEVDSVETE